MEPGSYVVVAEIRYVDSFAVSSQLFRVVEKKAFVGIESITKNTTLMIFLTFIIAIVISMLTYKLVSVREKRRGKKEK
jgi:heme/copper-type cytochrome/quinol oxidase subunit 2